MDMKLELVTLPVSDVDRAKAFYVDQMGFVPEHDVTVEEGLRFVQLTPPGSACSIAIGEGLVDSEPGSVKGMQMVVADAAAAHTELLSRGAPATGPEAFPWGKFVYVDDPDGNRWALQELVPREPAAA
jgi:catechol 2,3-dioxygenase-like lactoylglutathione lyase family enzyme